MFIEANIADWVSFAAGPSLSLFFLVAVVQPLLDSKANFDDAEKYSVSKMLCALHISINDDGYVWVWQMDEYAGLLQSCTNLARR